MTATPTADHTVKPEKMSYYSYPPPKETHYQLFMVNKLSKAKKKITDIQT